MAKEVMKPFTMRLPDSLKTALEARALAEGLSIGEWVRKLLEATVGPSGGQESASLDVSSLNDRISALESGLAELRGMLDGIAAPKASLPEPSIIPSERKVAPRHPPNVDLTETEKAAIAAWNARRGKGNRGGAKPTPPEEIIVIARRLVGQGVPIVGASEIVSVNRGTLRKRL